MTNDKEKKVLISEEIIVDGDTDDGEEEGGLFAGIEEVKPISCCSVLPFSEKRGVVSRLSVQTTRKMYILEGAGTFAVFDWC